jgi:hypothetical protein
MCAPDIQNVKAKWPQKLWLEIIVSPAIDADSIILTRHTSVRVVE